MTYFTEPASTQNHKWPQIIAVVFLLLLVFCSGIHSGWPSPSIPKLISDDFPLNISSDDASYIATVSSVAQIIGNLLCSFLIDRIGRKLTLLSTAPLFFFSLLLIRFSSISIGMLYAARVLGGIAEGGCSILVPIYIGEISEPKIRGLLSSLHLIFLASGVLFINLVGFYCSIETAAIASMPVPILFLVLFAFMPQSPYFLLMKNKVEKARTSLKMLRWNRNVDDELSGLKKDVERQMSERGHLQDLFIIDSNRRSIITSSVLTIIQIFSGFPALTMYAQTYFSEATDALPQQWAAVLMQGVKLVTMFIGMAIIDVVGRRILTLVSSAGCFITLLFVSIFFYLRDYTSLKVDDYNWLSLVGVLLFVVSFVIGLGVTVPCLIGELFCASVKSKAICAVSILHALCVFGSTKMFQSLSDNYSTGAPFAVFAIIQLLGFGFCWRFVLETKNKTLEEIQQDLKKSNSHIN